MKTMTKILISCGDSWPNGDFCWIDCEQPDYSQKEDRTHSYINTLANYFNFETTINLASGGLSNDESIYKLKNFMNDSWKFHSDNTTHILFGTTSLNRFFYSQGSMNLIQEDKDFFRFHEKYLPQQFLLKKLNLELSTLKNHCESLGITFNIYNTFNKLDLQQCLLGGTDLLSAMTYDDFAQRDNNFKAVVQDKKFNLAVSKGLLDPKTYHPSKQGSKFIASLLIKELHNVYS